MVCLLHEQRFHILYDIPFVDPRLCPICPGFVATSVIVALLSQVIQNLLMSCWLHKHLRSKRLDCTELVHHQLHQLRHCVTGKRGDFIMCAFLPFGIFPKSRSSSEESDDSCRHWHAKRGDYNMTSNWCGHPSRLYAFVHAQPYTCFRFLHTYDCAVSHTWHEWRNSI